MKRANFNDLWYNPVAEADRPHVQQAAQARQVHRRDVQPLGAQDRHDEERVGGHRHAEHRA